MKVLLVILLSWAFPMWASATTYYVRADGSATKVNAIGPTTDSTACMSLATFNASTFSAGDTVYFSDKGGSYTAALVVPSGGTAASPITYAAASGESPTIGATAGSYLLGMSKSNIVVGGFALTNGAANGEALEIGTGTNIFIYDMTISKNPKYAVVSDGVNRFVTLSNVVISFTTNNIDLYAFGTQNYWTLLDVGINGQTRGMTFLTTTNITFGNCWMGNGGIILSTCGGTLTMTNVTVTNRASSHGLYLHHNSWVAGSIVSNLYSSGFSSDGLRVLWDSNLTVANCTNNSNGNAGFNLYWTTNIVLSDCMAASNSVLGFCVDSNSTTLALSNCAAVRQTSGTGYYVRDGASSVSFNGCFSLSNLWGSIASIGVHDVVYTNGVSSYNADLGFNVGNLGPDTDSHDIIFHRCEAHHNGTKSSTVNNTGFGAHFQSYNITYVSCFAHDNTGGGYALVSQSSGLLNGCVSSNNAANWSLSGGGGVDQNRGGYYFSLSGINTNTLRPWIITNCIAVKDYPRLLFEPTTFTNALDYNYYCPISNTLFSTYDGTTTVGWTNYHGTNEPHSMLFTVPMILRRL